MEESHICGMIMIKVNIVSPKLKSIETENVLASRIRWSQASRGQVCHPWVILHWGDLVVAFGDLDGCYVLFLSSFLVLQCWDLVGFLDSCWFKFSQSESRKFTGMIDVKSLIEIFGILHFLLWINLSNGFLATWFWKVFLRFFLKYSALFTSLHG